jgi:hypothetical protein
MLIWHNSFVYVDALCVVTIEQWDLLKIACLRRVDSGSFGTGLILFDEMRTWFKISFFRSRNSIFTKQTVNISATAAAAWQCIKICRWHGPILYSIYVSNFSKWCLAVVYIGKNCIYVYWHICVPIYTSLDILQFQNLHVFLCFKIYIFLLYCNVFSQWDLAVFDRQIKKN